MSAKVVALAGANGYVGKAFADAFLNTKGFQLRILARASSIDSAPLQEFKSRGASLHPISYDDEASLVKALDGVDVLVSTVAAAALTSAQIPLIKAAKSAGVKTFFPSEYGGAFEDDNPSPPFQAKKLVIQTAKEHGLAIATLNNGPFPEYVLIPPLGLSFAEKRVTIWGDGNAKNSWTTVRSIGDWLANVLKTVPVEQLQDKDLRIQGESASLNEVVELWERKHKDKLNVEYRSLEELDDRINADPNDFLAILLKGFALGQGYVSGKDNALYPDWKPDTIESVL